MESEQVIQRTKKNKPLHILEEQKIQRRLSLGLTYLRILNRMTANEVTVKTGVNVYLVEAGERPVSLLNLVKLQKIYGSKAIADLLWNTWQDNGAWTEKALEQFIANEQAKWEAEKKG